MVSFYLKDISMHFLVINVKNKCNDVPIQHVNSACIKDAVGDLGKC